MVHAAGSGSQMFLRPAFTSNTSIALVTALEKKTGFRKTTNTQRTWCANLPSRGKRCTRETEGFCACLEITYLQAGIEEAACHLWWDQHQLQQHHECPRRKSSSPGHLQEARGAGESSMGITQGPGARNFLKYEALCFTTPASHCMSLREVKLVAVWFLDMLGVNCSSCNCFKKMFFFKKKNKPRKKDVMKGIVCTRN